MRSLFDQGAYESISQRLDRLSATTNPQWGKMSSAQMLAHCRLSLQVPLGELKPPIGFMTLLGKMMKGRVLGPKPFGKNSPTAPAFKVTDQKEFVAEKEQFIVKLTALTKGPSSVKHDIHPFLGKMQTEEWGTLHAKHIDHHFSQFGI